MENKVTIIMYHYIEDLKNPRFSRIKGLNPSLFKEQINYLQKHCNIITMELLINAIEAKETLPPKAVLLTFDDAYMGHYLYVFPLLKERKLQGSFYIPVKAITENTVLDVNKIHFILASVEDRDILIKDIFTELDKFRDEHGLESNRYYYDNFAHPGIWDTKEEVFIKRLLQIELEENLRNIIVNRLFKRYVSVDEGTFSRELYMNLEQIKCIEKNGMHVGSHGYDHYWLGSLPKEKQEEEIGKSTKFIKDIGGDGYNWTMCYPYGDYNQDTVDILADKDCKLALTTEFAVCNLEKHHRFKLPRLDTKCISKDINSVTNYTTIKPA